MTATLSPTITKTHYKNLRIKFNVRYGLDEERLLAAYEQGIEELKESIIKWGFKPNEPIEVYESEEVSAEGEVIYEISEGHRRYLSCLSIFQEQPGKSLGDDLAPGEVRIFVSPKPDNLLKLVSSQIGANRTEPNTKMDLCKAIDAAFNSMEGKKTEKFNLIGDELGMTRQTVASHYDAYQLPVEIKDWIQSSEIDPEIDITLSFTVASEITNYYKVEDASKLLLKALEIVQNEPGEVETFGKAVTRNWLHELAAKIKLGKKPPSKEKSQPESEKESKPESVESNQESQVQGIGSIDGFADNQSTYDDSGTGNKSEKTEAKTSAESQSASTSTKPKTQPQKPIERIETMINKSLKNEVGRAFVEGRADVSSNEFVVKMPMNIGLEFAELLAAWIDPSSNPPEQIISATAVIEETEF